MLHNLFHSLPCIILGIQISSLCRYDPHHNICGTTILWIFSACLMFLKEIHNFLPPFHDTFFFWHHAYTHSLSQKFILLESLISGPVSSPLLPVYLISSLHFFFLYSIHIYISTYLWYLRICEKNSPFFWYTKIPHTHCIFFLNHHIFKYCFHFLRLNNVLPSFFLHHELFLLFFLLVSSASSASFFWRSHTLLAFFCFLLVDWYQSTLLFHKLFAWTSVYHHTHHTTSWLRSSGLFLYFT